MIDSFKNGNIIKIQLSLFKINKSKLDVSAKAIKPDFSNIKQEEDPIKIIIITSVLDVNPEHLSLEIEKDIQKNMR